MLEYHDPQTAEHSIRLSFLARNFGRFLGLSALEVRNLAWGACLHDIGKIAVPKDVLNKPGRLSPEEWRMIRQHTIVGEEMCEAFPVLRGMLPIVRHHHERWDGSGYPDGLAGEEISFLVRVFQVVDIYDALMEHRPYKPSLSVGEALGTLQMEVDRGWQDPEVVRQFFSFVRQRCPASRPVSDACTASPNCLLWESTASPGKFVCPVIPTGAIALEQYH